MRSSEADTVARARSYRGNTLRSTFRSVSEIIELRSDTFTLPTPEMMAAIARAPLGDDVYGEDPTVRRLEELAAERVRKEDAIFMPSGTMANLACLLAQAPRGTRVLLSDQSDIFVYEAGGASVCGGLVYEPIPTQSDGTLKLDHLAAAMHDRDDPQFALPSVVCCEQPHNRAGGRVLPIAWLAELQAFARRESLQVHLDGARLFNAALALGVDVGVVTQYADSLQFCLSKGLSAPVGSMVAGSRALVAQVRRIRKMLGGGMRQAGVLAAAGIVALETMIDRLAEDHAHAQQFAAGLRELAGVELISDPVETNMVFFRINHPRHSTDSFLVGAAKRGVRLATLGEGRIRAALHSGVSQVQVRRALAVLGEVLRDGQ